MGNWASYLVRRTADGPVPGAESTVEGGPDWSSWTLSFRDPDELAEPAGPGPAILVSEADGGMAVVIGRNAGAEALDLQRTRLLRRGPARRGAAPKQSELDATRPVIAMNCVVTLFERMGIWRP